MRSLPDPYAALHRTDEYRPVHDRGCPSTPAQAPSNRGRRFDAAPLNQSGPRRHNRSQTGSGGTSPPVGHMLAPACRRLWRPWRPQSPQDRPRQAAKSGGEPPCREADQKNSHVSSRHAGRGDEIGLQGGRAETRDAHWFALKPVPATHRIDDQIGRAGHTCAAAAATPCSGMRSHFRSPRRCPP